MTGTGLTVLPQGADRFGPATFQRPLASGGWVTAGDFQGDGALDLYVVQRCRNGVNDPDILLLGDGTGTSFSEVQLPQATEGCGDVVEPIDLTGDGTDEFIVLNGFGRTARGPLQVIASSVPDSPCTVIGTSSGETLTGTAGDDVICALGGNDTIDGKGGHDVLLGGEGSDLIIGGDGNDTLDGGGGNDTLEGGIGDDKLDGGSGRDIARYSSLTQGVTVDLGAGTATGQGADTLEGVEVVHGSPTGDSLLGGTAADTLNGLGGNDHITGRGGADRLLGGGGGDTLIGVDGVEGNDTLDGKAGVDTCSADPNDRLLSCP